MNSAYRIKKEILEVCKRVYERGYVVASEGNVSAKVTDDRILSTPSGFSKGFLSEDQLVLCDLDGRVVSGGFKPSSEIKMHLMVYKERADVAGVVHAHPPYATGFAVAGISIRECVLPEVILQLGSIPLTRYGTPSTEEVPESVRKYVHDYDALLLENHGALTVGKDLMDAYYKMETVEHSAQIIYIARQMGNVNVLSSEKVQRLVETSYSPGERPADFLCETAEEGSQDSCESGDQEVDQDTIREIVRRVMDQLRVVDNSQQTVVMGKHARRP